MERTVCERLSRAGFVISSCVPRLWCERAAAWWPRHRVAGLVVPAPILRYDTIW